MTKFSLRRFLSVVTLVGAIVGTIGFVIVQKNTEIREGYFCDWTASMIIEFVQNNDGAWPKGWCELELPFEAIVKRSGRPWELQEIKSHIAVDWTISPVQVIGEYDESCSFISSKRNGVTRSTEIANKRIFNFLNKTNVPGGVGSKKSAD